MAGEDALDRGGAALDPADVLLVVEVISPNNAGRDLMLKRHEYAAAGIPRYWLVEPRKQTLAVLEHVGGGYREATQVGVTDVYRAEAPFPLAFAVADIF
ncbi:hypothetical protein A6A27_06925 [Micromonospora sp. CB01531]|nr:hypothetical protein A6A27_06925 [Micromonospora sp. CB01531]